MKYFAIGDIHGGTWKFQAIIRDIDHNMLGKNDNAEDKTCFLLGDVGIKYGNTENLELLDIMSNSPGNFVIIRGNHDSRYIRDYSNDSRFNLEEIEWSNGRMWVSPEYDGVMFAPDEGGVYNIDGHGVAIVPGAYSIDKDYRLFANWPYEPEEQLNTTEMLALLDEIKSHDNIDTVLSHTCPFSWEEYIAYTFASGIDQSSVDKNTEKFLDAVLEEIGEDNLKGWYFGHYHDDIDFLDDKAHMLINEPLEIPYLQ